MPIRYLEQPYLLAGRRIDPITGTLSYREAQKRLRRKELEVLAMLAAADSGGVPRSAFIQQLWHGNPLVGEQGLNDTISTLRRSLQDTDRENPLILTLPRRGYQLRASVRLISREGDLIFVAGTAIEGRLDWRLKQLLESTDAHESWLAEDGQRRRIFRFCRNEQQLRKLRREIVLMRYLREALAGVRNVTTILDWQLEDPPYYLELAAPACGNLRGVMQGKSIPEIPERWRLMQQVAEALALVHAAGVVHRDLGPDSVLVDRCDGRRVALLGEFGLAALDDRQRLDELGIDAAGLSLKTGLPGPTTAATAPECIAGAAASPASDMYALGVLITQTLRGDFQKLVAGFGDFPAEIAALLQRCCATDAAARPSAAEMAAQLRAWTLPTPLPGSPATTNEAPDLAPSAPTALESAPLPGPIDVAPPTAALVPGTAAPTPVPLIGQQVDRYRVVRELGQGGMGVVYLAEQREPVQRRVALKLIRAGLDSRQVLTCFEAERQALALMNHPNISAIFDAGTSSGGHPYFAMEFVPGKDIVSYCNDARLDLCARVRLFLQVCDGVLHAHQKGLIHRDLKPGNILVKQNADQSALVKLIDFGVAKSLAGGPGATLNTRIGGFVGTPVYSCPEQVIDPTRDIDTRADLYSLGVVLFEILVGVPPYSAEDLSYDTPAELARRLRDMRTPSMNRRYSELNVDERQRVAKARHLSEQSLSAQLSSDLNWIVGKCIAVDPEDRYATVQELRQELQRWLDNKPIEARPASVWYRLRKLMRRNRLNTALIGGAALALLVTTTAALIAYQRAELARVEARLTATFKTERIRNLDVLGMGMDIRTELLRKLEGLPLDATAQALLDARINEINFADIAQLQLNRRHLQPALTVIERDFSTHPAVQADLLLALSASARALGALDTAEQAQQRALALAQSGPARNEVLAWRVHFERGLILSARRLDAEAEAVVNDVFVGLRARLGAHDPLSVQVMEALIDLRLDRMDPTALPLVREWIELSSTLPDAGAGLTRARQQLRLGSALAAAGQFAEARTVLQGALAGNFKDDTDAILLRSQIEAALGHIYMETGLRMEAADMLEQASAGYRQALGTRHEATLRLSLQVAENLRRFGKLDEATALQDTITLLVRETYGDNHPLALEVQQKRGIVLALRGQLSEAHALLTQLRERLISQGGGNEFINPWIASAPLVSILIDMGKLDDAESLYLKLMEQADQSPVRVNGVIDIHAQYARLLQARDQHTAALESLRATILLAQQKIPKNETFLLVLQSQLGELLVANGQYDEAESVLEQTLRTEESKEFERRMRAPVTLGRLAGLRFAQGRHPEALVLSEEAVSRSRLFMAEGDPRWKRLLAQHEQIKRAQP